MLEFIATLIVVLISVFAIILGGVLVVGAMGLIINKAIAIPGDEGWIARQPWRKIVALALGLIVLLCVEISVAARVGVFRDDASLHCGSGTAYHSNGKAPWTCELS